MAGVNRTVVTSAVLVVLVVVGLYILDPTLGGLLKNNEGFANGNTMSAAANSAQASPPGALSGQMRMNANVNNANNMSGGPNQNANVNAGANNVGANNAEAFQDLSTMEGPATFGDAQAPAGCYPRDQLTPAELLPKDPNSVWAQQNPMGAGSLKGKNFLSAGALIGINTVGQSLRNANWQLRSEPPNPQVPVSVFFQTTIEPDANRRTLEIN
jgi:hypothetical protein